MTPSKIDLFVSFFSYGGNGGIAMQHPSIRRWWAQTLLKCKTDERFKHRIGEVYDVDLSDTPITHTRCRAVQMARESRSDVIIMVDSDNVIDWHLGEDGTKPWFDSSFAFLLEQFDKGKPVAIGAPYCGPPPHENVYVFQWRNFESDDPNMGHQLAQYDREHAAIMAGIMPVAALPTGVTMFDMRLFDLIAPPYFDYEYRDKFHSEKVSTEDVVSTRDMSLVVQQKLGYNPIFCNWDAWAGHAKPKIVGKPRSLESDKVSKRWMNAMSAPPSTQKLRFIGDPTEVTGIDPCLTSHLPETDRLRMPSNASLRPSDPVEDTRVSENSPSFSARNGEGHRESSKL